MFQLNGQTIRIDQDLVIGEGDDAITVPAKNLEDQATREQYGIVYVADPVRADDRYYWNGDVSTPKSVEYIKSLRAAEIAASRYRLEIGGVTLANGSKINTERDAQAMIASALLRVTRKPTELIDWKGGDGVWVKIDKATVEMIADVVGDHVQACFSAERARHDALTALDDFDALVSFDTTVSLVAPA